MDDETLEELCFLLLPLEEEEEEAEPFPIVSMYGMYGIVVERISRQLKV
jgi:hypothetical protein